MLVIGVFTHAIRQPPMLNAIMAMGTEYSNIAANFIPIGTTAATGLADVKPTPTLNVYAATGK
jgi:hypothetical protein